MPENVRSGVGLDLVLDRWKILARGNFLSIIGPPILLAGCGPSPTDKELLENILAFEICESASALILSREGDLSLLRFDEIYRFQISGTPECLAEIIADSKQAFACEEYPAQLACADTKGNVAIFDINQDELILTYST